jgi:hypothetical protein
MTVRSPRRRKSRDLIPTRLKPDNKIDRCCSSIRHAYLMTNGRLVSTVNRIMCPIDRFMSTWKLLFQCSISAYWSSVIQASCHQNITFSRHDSPDKMAHFELSNNQSLTYHSNDIYGYGEMTNSHKTIFLVFYCSVLLMNFLWYSLLSTQRPSLFKLSYHKTVDIKFSAHDAFLE